MISWRQIVEFVGHMPSGVWVALAVLNMMMTIGTWSAARRRMHRAGQRVADPGLVSGPAKAKDTWMRMCADGDLVLGPLNDDDHARTYYDLSAKQLRNIRNAATTGALRRRADELGVPLPAGYLDRPAGSRINGHATPRATA
jgi:hypothetical protein